MVGQRTPVGEGGADRLTRVAQMVCNAVELLNQAMDEIKAENADTKAQRGQDDDRDPSGTPVGNPE